MNYIVESIELHDSLNPKLWLPDNSLRPEVKEQLEIIVDEFINELEKNEIPIRIIDVHLVGSNASYNYSDTSDLDVHLVANFEEVTCDPYILSLLYAYFKTYFNDKYDISIHGIDIELFIEDMNSSTISNGIYSLYDNEWIKFPEKIVTPEVDISKDIVPYYNMYKSAIGANDGVEAQQLLDDLYRLRRNSLSTDGEFGVGNLIFKEFRSNGWVDILKDEVAKYKSQQWSLENLNEALDDMLSMESLINEARARGVKPDDIFERYDALCDSTAFFNSITDGTQQSYKDSPKKRIALNTNKNEFYKVLMSYLDSLGTGDKSYKKLEPALVERTAAGVFPRDGRHRAQFCMLLGIPLPVRFLNREARQNHEPLNSSFNKLTRVERNSSASSSTPNLLTDAPNVINDVVCAKSNGIEEDYLDSDERFWDYKTAPVEGNQIFDPNRGESPWANTMIKLARTGKQDEEGHIVSVVEMTPRQYFEACAKGFETSVETQINQVKNDKGILDKLKQVITQYKVRFPITYLNYSGNSFGQEGRHRMYVAAQLFGWDVKYPVLIINQTEEAKDKQRKERIIRYINKALDKALLYSYNSIQDIKEELQYLLEDYLDNFTLDVTERNNKIIITVDGASIQVDKSEFKFNDLDDEERVDNIDIDDFIDIDDLDDILRF